MPLVVGCSLHDVIAARRLGPDRPDPPPHPLVDSPRAALPCRGRPRPLPHRPRCPRSPRRGRGPSRHQTLQHHARTRRALPRLPERLRPGPRPRLRLPRTASETARAPLSTWPPKRSNDNSPTNAAATSTALGVTLFEALTLERFLDLPPGLSSVVLLAYLSHNRPRRAAHQALPPPQTPREDHPDRHPGRSRPSLHHCRRLR